MKKVIIIVSAALFTLASITFLLNEKSVEKEQTHQPAPLVKEIHKLSYK